VKKAKRFYSSYRGSGVIPIENNVLYKLKSINNTQDNVIKWDIKMTRFTYMYVIVKVKTVKNNKQIYTTRTLLYYPRNSSIGYTPKGYIKIGVGNILDKKWHTIRRDLIKDLHDYDPKSQLLEIKEFWIKGQGELDNIETTKYRNYEDGSNTTNWDIFGNKSNARVKLSYDKYHRKNVIKLTGTGMNTGYALKPFYIGKSYKSIQWNMKYNENFAVFIKVNTKYGIRYISYKNHDSDTRSAKNPKYLFIGLGSTISNGKWHTITRNLEHDLKRFEPNNQLKYVITFMVRGSGYLDNISLLNSTYVEDDPIYGHKHYFMTPVGLSTELNSNTYNFYVTRLAERHNVEPETQEAIVLYSKHKNWKKWSNKILVRARKGVGLINFDISKTPFNNSEILLKYNERRIYGGQAYSLSKAKIINLYNIDRSRELNFKGIPHNFFFYGNTLFTPTNKLLISTHSDKEVKIFRSVESYDTDIPEYHMEEIAFFKKEGEIFLEPVMTYAFNKLIVAIRKDIKWFNGRDNQIEDYKNTNGELYFINDLEGGNINSYWQKKVLNVEIHGMHMPAYQGNYFLMIASNGKNRQNILTINSSDYNLNNLLYNKKAFFIKHRRGGGYPSTIRNEDEFIVLYWEETNDLRKTNIIIKDLYDK